MPPPKTAEERKATRRAAAARYYQRHREEVLDRVKAYQSTHPDRKRGQPRSAADQRASELRRRLGDLKEAVHPSVLPVVQTLQEIGADKALFRNEMRVLEDVLSLVTAKIVEKQPPPVIAATPPPSPEGPKPKHPNGRFL